MSSDTERLLEEALQLAPGEREALAGRLFDSLQRDDADAEAAWQAEIERRINDEIERRINELDQGKVMTIPWDEARHMILGDADDTTRDLRMGV